MAVVGAAAAADDAKVRKQAPKPVAEPSEFLRVTFIQHLCRIQFGMAEARGIGPDAADPSGPVTAKRGAEMRRVGAVDHVVKRRA